MRRAPRRLLAFSISAALVSGCASSESGATPVGTAGDATSLPSGSAADSTSTSDAATAPLVITAEAMADTIDVDVLPDEAAELTATVDGVTFTISLPAGAVAAAMAFHVTPARTNLGNPAMLVEPAGWGLRRPGTVTVEGSDADVLAWGPTGTARRLPESSINPGTAPIASLGGVTVAHDAVQAKAADATSGTEAEAWAREQEDDEAEDGDGEHDESINQNHTKGISVAASCTADQRKNAAAALEAARTGQAIGAAPTSPPECFDVTTKITITLVWQGNGAEREERMSGSAPLTPKDDGHAGFVPLATEVILSGTAQGKCTFLAPSPGGFDVTARWPGDGLAELRLHQTTVPTQTMRCPDTIDLEMPVVIADIIKDIESQGPLVVRAPVTEGSFYIFSLLDVVERVGIITKNGAIQVNSGGVTARYTFTVEVLYKLPAG